MTTIAYRDGILCADRRAYSGDKTFIGAKTKAHRLEDGTLLGVSTTSVGGDALVRRWVEAGCPPPIDGTELKPESFELLLVRPGGQVFYANNNLELTGPLEGEYFAAGSGSHYALGAMAMGAQAHQAVAIASDLDVWSGLGITTVEQDPR